MPANCLKVLICLEQRWLLVFDNVQSWDSVSPYWPISTKAATASIIVTAQKSSDWHLNHRIQLEPFDLDVGSDFLLSQLKKTTRNADVETSRESARRITELSGGLPLWVSQASGSINLAQCSLEEYLENFRTSSALLGGNRRGLNERTYERDITSTFGDTMEELSKDAVNLLFMLALLNHCNVSEDLLLGDHKDHRLAFLHIRNKAMYV